MVRVGTSSLLIGCVLNSSSYLVMSNRTNTHIRGREVGAQLFGLHFLSSLEPAAQTQVDVTIITVTTLITKSSDTRSLFGAHHTAALRLEADKTGFTVAVPNAALAVLLTVQWHAGADSLDIHIYADRALTAVLVAGTFLLVTGILFNSNLSGCTVNSPGQNFGLLNCML